MLFTYWTGESDGTPGATRAWLQDFPDFKIFGDSDVLAALDEDWKKDLFQRIRIPACKSDIARMVMLHAHGGFYFDAHTAPDNGFALARTLELLSRFDLVVFDQIWNHEHDHDVHLMNGVLGGRKGAPILREILDGAFANLHRHFDAESQTKEHVPYNIYVLTGPWHIGNHILDRSLRPIDLTEAHRGSVFLEKMPPSGGLGFQLYAQYGYRRPNDHWSERQLHEPLFRHDDSPPP